MVYPNPDQPRKFFNEESLKELSDSIKSQGVLVPILVQKNKNKKDSYLIIAGERRWRASKLAQLGKIKAIVISNKDEKTNSLVSIIENVQRDVNISFVNELALIFDRMNIETHDVLEAAATKWNFLPFKPGLVGGHCIGVDPYYLAQKAEEYGYNAEIILAGRKMNDSMGDYVASEVIKIMIKKDIKIKSAEILILGITFKENCPDIRNTKVVDVIKSLKEYGVNVIIYDPWASEETVLHEYNLVSVKELPKEKYDAVVLTVAHDKFKKLDFNDLRKDISVLYDVKGILNEGVDRKL